MDKSVRGVKHMKYMTVCIWPLQSDKDRKKRTHTERTEEKLF